MVSSRTVAAGVDTRQPVLKIKCPRFWDSVKGLQMTNENVATKQKDHKDHLVEIILDGKEVTSPAHQLNGKQIRELGPKDRWDGFETQQIDEHGHKIRTIPDNEEIKLHKGERFRTVPNHGGPGACV